MFAKLVNFYEFPKLLSEKVRSCCNNSKTMAEKEKNEKTSVFLCIMPNFS